MLAYGEAALIAPQGRPVAYPMPAIDPYIVLHVTDAGVRAVIVTTRRAFVEFVGGLEMTSVLVRASCALLLITLSVPVTAVSRDEMAVPDLVGLPEADVLTIFVDLGLVAGERTVVPEGEPGIVVAQDPEAGTTVADGAMVDYTVVAGTALASSPGADELPSTGPSTSPATTEGAEADQTTVVPDLVGLPGADALAALEAASFVPDERLIVTEGGPVSSSRRSQARGLSYPSAPRSATRSSLPHRAGAMAGTPSWIACGPSSTRWR